MTNKYYCSWKFTIDEMIKEEKGLERKVQVDECFAILKICYLCDGYNFYCHTYNPDKTYISRRKRNEKIKKFYTKVISRLAKT